MKKIALKFLAAFAVVAALGGVATQTACADAGAGEGEGE
jgi:hypothetical protein